MIYGYQLKTVNEYGLYEMKEITFAVQPNVLREIARFLDSMAAIMEAGGFDDCSHRHIQSTVPDWDQRFPDKDIVVSSPR